jgi:hypothetical protein
VNTLIATAKERATRCMNRDEGHRALVMLGRSHEIKLAAVHAHAARGTLRGSLAERCADLTTELEERFQALTKRIGELK